LEFVLIFTTRFLKRNYDFLFRKIFVLIFYQGYVLKVTRLNLWLDMKSYYQNLQKLFHLSTIYFLQEFCLKFLINSSPKKEAHQPKFDKLIFQNSTNQTFLLMVKSLILMEPYNREILLFYLEFVFVVETLISWSFIIW
jgi:hypothetical protein